MPTTPELNEAAEGGSQHPLVVRLQDCRKRIGAMCSEGRGICQTLDDASAEITKLRTALARIVKWQGEFPPPRRVLTFVNERRIA